MKKKSWFVRRRERLNAERYARGFDWAAGQLLRGLDSDSVEQFLNAHVRTNENDPFDKGSYEAVRIWKQHIVVQYP